MNTLNKPKKILAVCSSGGHLLQLHTLITHIPNDAQFTVFWISFNKSDVQSILKDKKVCWAYYPTNRDLKNLIKNFLLALRIINTEHPDFIISTGAGVAIPFYYLARIFGIKTIYIESFARKQNLSLTGKVIYPVVDHLFVQSKELESKYKKAVFKGTIY